ncbi:DUF4255 domain-containing protein [Thalassococcus sp. BH17M4-6]|uniref:DUF4255 domain-containing protein n=1 Tax=Thalassococcus sp. BH17M4-6 TaxID=3413148 RepID=UPI003BE8828B
MIDTTMEFLVRALNAYLRQRLSAEEDLARLASPAPLQGGSTEEIEDKLLITLVNLEREGIARNASQTTRPQGDGYVRVPQPLNINLIFMASARFQDKYATGLKVLGNVVGFFQANPLFTPQSHPELPPHLQRLSVEWREMDLQAMHNLWSAMGSNYMPSAVYKARMLVVEDYLTGPEVTDITGIATEAAQ